MNAYMIRPYGPRDENGWFRCRVLSFLDTAYFDKVLTEKESYASRSIELVAVTDDTIVGLLDIEIEESETDRAGMIWHVAVHPDHRSRGIARSLLLDAIERARELDLVRLEAWTRNDRFVNDWYVRQGFALVDSYYHVYAGKRETLSNRNSEGLSGTPT